MQNKAEKISQFYKSHKRMPSFGEMQKLLGYKSKAAVNYFVDKLITAGLVEKDKTGRIVPSSSHFAEATRDNHVRLLGVIEAGFPTSAEEELIDTMGLDEFLIGNREATFILRVKGESMIDAGIMPGDMVLVERGRSPKPGEIVIAEVDGEYTMKYFRMRRGKPYLEAANKKFKDIYPEHHLTIAAVVTGVIRKYAK